jgi:transposase
VHEATRFARQRQTTQEFKERYAIRAGVEGTLSQGLRAFDLRQARYIGSAKTHLQHLIIATAINLARLLDWKRRAPSHPHTNFSLCCPSLLKTSPTVSIFAQG